MTCIAPLSPPPGAGAPRWEITALGMAIRPALRVICATACADSPSKSTYRAAQTKIGESPAPLGWNIRVAESRWNGEFVLFDIDILIDAAGLRRLTEMASLGAVNEHDAAYGASVLTRPNDALLNATESVIGAHAAVWVTRD
ncbi:hypothetical protein ACQ86B_23895 [Mycolicibacterium aichiense]|uniref:hypothetical protein n=1 Tax=Mycolicibacterium aichiense TaxID=1799 RepID=UPI003D67D535